MAGTEIIGRFIEHVVTPAMYLLFGVGLFLFLFGLVEFLWSIEEGGKRKEGIQHMTWGIVGMLIMVSYAGIIMLLDSTFGLQIQEQVRSGVDVRGLRDIPTIDLSR